MRATLPTPLTESKEKGNTPSVTKSLAGADKAFAEAALSGVKLHLIRQTTNPQEQQALAEFIQKQVSEVIDERENKALFYGEETAQSLSAGGSTRSSIYMMKVGRGAAAHCHPHGERNLLVFSGTKPWYFYAGGTKSDEELGGSQNRRWLKIKIPAGSQIQLAFPPGFYHKFESALGQDTLGAFSFHRSDEREIQAIQRQLEEALRQQAVASGKDPTKIIKPIITAKDPSLMEKLTRKSIVDATDANTIAGGAVNIQDALGMIRGMSCASSLRSAL